MLQSTPQYLTKKSQRGIIFEKFIEQTSQTI
jgi:hypothetical protein